jgi:REP element-mobilizing transposase RayT
MQSAKFYHIYNHANGNENLFRKDENYLFFLKKFSLYINPVADTYAYCLMPNHFHFLIRVKEAMELEATFGKFKTFQKLELKVSKQFSNLFSCYTQSYNKVYSRKGSLFMPNFKKKEITSDDYLTSVIHYIHNNPIHHGFTSTINEWPYTSYHAMLLTKNTALKREEVLSWFGGTKRFTEFHSIAHERIPAIEIEV